MTTTKPHNMHVPPWTVAIIGFALALTGATVVAALFLIFVNRAEIDQSHAEIARLDKQIVKLGGIPGRPDVRIVTVTPAPGARPVRVVVPLVPEPTTASAPRQTATPHHASSKPKPSPAPRRTASPTPTPTPCRVGALGICVVH